MKKIIKITALIIVLFSVLNITAFANAGPGYVKGTDSIGIVTQFANCPITVEKEVLTFEIDSPPDLDSINFYYDEWMTEYKDKVTAEYTFHNSTEYDLTTTLYFPFGEMSDYINLYDDEGNLEFASDNFKYSVTVDGQPVEKKIRFSYSPDEFNAYTEINKLKDGYINHRFFKPDMPVVKYIYRDSAYGTDENGDRKFKLEWENKDDKTAIYVKDMSSWQSTGDRKGTIGVHIYGDEDIEIYLIGQQPESPPEVKGYVANGLTATLYKTEEMTFEQFVTEEYALWKEEANIPKEDWYNIYVDYFIQSTDTNKMFVDMMDYYFYWDNLMRWYVYDITIPAGETVINTVTAPLYPYMNYEYEPYIYEYTYLLSPAKGWAEFGDIEININTPYYILENSVEGFEKTDIGYVYKGSGLPEGELEFVLSESEKTKKEIQWEYSIFLLIPLAVIVVLVVFFALLIKHGERKYKEQQRQANNEKDN